MEETDIYKKYNAGEFNMGINAEDTELEKAESELERSKVELAKAEELQCETNEFLVKNSQGVSINGVGFCRGKYEIGQLVGNLTINEDIKNAILSLDAEAIRTNRHLG